MNSYDNYKAAVESGKFKSHKLISRKEYDKLCESSFRALKEKMNGDNFPYLVIQSGDMFIRYEIVKNTNVRISFLTEQLHESIMKYQNQKKE